MTETDRLMEYRKRAKSKFPGLAAVIMMLLSINIRVATGKGTTLSNLSLPSNGIIYLGEGPGIC